ncbi:uncharacterized protein LOC127263944 [Andrographis paniculata]|uniref:uncharacterized protein LOC127263944 n=1 Tax=Andrographis paniculata TaxID=175694 RepID=UPI0021E795CA|nr:uncharacterized protein LOC127263944 [Andrographis paniculata]
MALLGLTIDSTHVPLKTRSELRGEAEGILFDEDEMTGVMVADESMDRISMQRCIIGEGQTFKDALEFRRMLKNYCIATQKACKYHKNDLKKIIAACIDSSCGWRVYASYHVAECTFGIRTCNLQHTCELSFLQSRDHPHADANWISDVYRDKVRTMPSYKASDIQMHIQTDYGIDVKYHRAWRGKENAMRSINGGGRDSYGNLSWYCHALRECNPGSMVDCEVEAETRRFQRLFVCFNACKIGFLRGCRPLIFLDGTHLKNKYKGCLLSAVTIDGNDGMFTLAFSAVSVENDENWEWFCWRLRSALYVDGRYNSKEYTFFSDRHSGLLKSIPVVFPGAHHVMRRYPMHYKKRWKSVFNKATYAPLQKDFEQHITSVVEAMPLARNFIAQSQPQLWANSLFQGTRWRIINNNIAESWNSWVMSVMNERREKSEKIGSKLCPK